MRPWLQKPWGRVVMAMAVLTTAVAITVPSANNGGGDNLTGCFTNPSSCGYPDPDNTGTSGSLNAVPGASLPSGVTWDAPNEVLRVETNNVTLQNLDIPGAIAIDGDNVTIRNSRVILGDGGCAEECGSWGIRIGNSDTSVSGTTLEDLEICACDSNTADDDPDDPDTAQSKATYGVRNFGDEAATGTRLDIQGFTVAWKEAGTITDSYMTARRAWAGDHMEVYLSNGGAGTIVLDHNTMFTKPASSAVIAIYNDFGGINTVTVTDNFLAGSNYIMYGGAKNGTANVNGPVLVRDNRIARGNMDSSGYYPNGGALGLWAEFYGAATTSCNNYWDDDLSAAANPGGTIC